MKKYKVIFRKTAYRDLESIYWMICGEFNNSQAAFKVTQKIKAACSKLDIFPERGLQRDFLPAKYRTISMDRQFIITYQINDTTVEIKKIYYAGRDFEGDIPIEIIPD